MDEGASCFTRRRRARRPKRWQSDTGPIGSIALSPDEEVVACGTEDGEVRLVGLPGGKADALARHEDSVTSVDFSSDGGLLASASLIAPCDCGKSRMVNGRNRSLAVPGRRAACAIHPSRPTLAIQVQGELALRLLPLESLRAAFAENNLGW